MRIAVLGWGSLCWDPRALPLASDWHRGGPTLPIEFSRLSGRTDKKPASRLTLVIDEEAGTRVATRFAISADVDVPAARKSLHLREGAPTSRYIASIDLTADVRSATGSQPISDLLARWAKENGFDGVVWTALRPNFMEVLGKAYSWQTAFAFLDGLGTADQEEAFRYIRNAPEEVRTPFRAEFERLHPA